MKKFLVLVLISLFGFSACDYMIDDVAAHNGLIYEMDAVLNAETVFHDYYYAIEDGESVVFVSDAYDDFVETVDLLDDYMTNTTFATGQQVFVDEYNDLYKPSIDKYVEVSSEFIDFVVQNGYTFDSTEDMINKVDASAEDFINVHGNFIDNINLQADY